MSLGFEILRLLDYLILIYSCESLQVSGSKRRGFPKRPLPTLRLLMDHKRDAAMLKKLVFLGPIRLPDHNHGGPLLPGSTPTTTSSPPTAAPGIPTTVASSFSPPPMGHATYTPDDASHEEPPFPESGPPLTDPAPRKIPVYISTMKWA